jgi:hypothetical protein
MPPRATRKRRARQGRGCFENTVTHRLDRAIDAQEEAAMEGAPGLGLE